MGLAYDFFSLFFVYIGYGITLWLLGDWFLMSRWFIAHSDLRGVLSTSFSETLMIIRIFRLFDCSKATHTNPPLKIK